jgi:hypothetical protein
LYITNLWVLSSLVFVSAVEEELTAFFFASKWWTPFLVAVSTSLGDIRGIDVERGGIDTTTAI